MSRLHIAPMLLALGLALSSPAPEVWAQEPAAGAQEEPGSIPSAPSSSTLEEIDRILEQDLEALEDGAPTGYQAGGRRDPFRSLLERRNRPDARGPRPPGVPGLLIDDLTLKGVILTPQGGVAQVQASDSAASYLLREGDELFDGEVVTIRFKKDEVAEVVFKQGVDDVAAIKPFREVVKKITP